MQVYNGKLKNTYSDNNIIIVLFHIKVSTCMQLCNNLWLLKKDSDLPLQNEVYFIIFLTFHICHIKHFELFILFY